MPSPIRKTRRMFLSDSAATIGASYAASAVAADKADDDLLIVDCHAHIYGEDEQKYPTVENPYRPPCGKGTLAHLKQEMKSNGVRFVTAIQTSTYYRFDNRFTADSARDNSDFMAGVITLDPDNPESPNLLRHYVQDSNVRGMRSIPAKSGKLMIRESTACGALQRNWVSSSMCLRDGRTAARSKPLRYVIRSCASSLTTA